jgi:hypothetical protein
MTIHGLVALMDFACCYPVLRLARWAESRFGRLELAD